jgi:hypothetical protein
MPMRSLAAAVFVIALMASASIAQETEETTAPVAMPTATAFQPAYEPRTHGGPMRNFPPRTLDRGISGVAHLCCAPREDGTLDCNVALEWPDRSGFGQAALRMAEPMRLTPDSVAQYQALAVTAIQIPVEFRVLPLRDEVGAALDLIASRAQNLCGEGGYLSGPIMVQAERIR